MRQQVILIKVMCVWEIKREKHQEPVVQKNIGRICTIGIKIRSPTHSVLIYTSLMQNTMCLIFFHFKNWLFYKKKGKQLRS